MDANKDRLAAMITGFIGLINIGITNGVICYIGGGQTDPECTACSQTVYNGNIVQQVCTTTCAEGRDPDYGSTSWINCCYSDYCNNVNLGNGPPPTFTCYTGNGGEQSGCTVCTEVVNGGAIMAQQCASSCTAGNAPAYGKTAWTNCCSTDYCNGVNLGGGAGNTASRSTSKPVAVLVAVLVASWCQRRVI